jgi:hypothetical protein
VSCTLSSLIARTSALYAPLLPVEWQRTNSVHRIHILGYCGRDSDESTTLIYALCPCDRSRPRTCVWARQMQRSQARRRIGAHTLALSGAICAQRRVQQLRHMVANMSSTIEHGRGGIKEVKQAVSRNYPTRTMRQSWQGIRRPLQCRFGSPCALWARLRTQSPPYCHLDLEQALSALQCPASDVGTLRM